MSTRHDIITGAAAAMAGGGGLAAVLVAILHALAGGGAIGGLLSQPGIGYPNTLIYDHWIGRTPNSDLSIAESGTAKTSITMTTGDGAGGSAQRFTLNADGLSLHGAGVTPNIRSNGAECMRMQTGDAQPTEIDACPTGLVLTAGGSASSAIAKFGWTFYGIAATGPAASATRDYTVWNTPAAASGAGFYVPIQCSWQNSTAGLTGGTCTYELFDNTTATAKCVVSQACTAAAFTNASCAGSGTIAANDQMTFRIIAPAGDTSGLGTFTCTGSE